MSFKIALMGIYHESNTFVSKPTTLADFENGHLLKGEAIIKEYRDAHHEIGGMIEVLEKEGMELVPLMFAEATPGGTIDAPTYKILLDEMMQELERVLPVDACLVIPHGAGVSEEFPDMDGHWLKVLRSRLGNEIPIIGTLDLHANVSQQMVNSTNALIAYKRNPHVDQRQRGKEAAQLLVDFLKGKIHPVQALVQIPMAISIEQQFTDNEPCKSMYSFAEQLAEEDGILSISIQHGFPYADVEEMGTSVIVVSDGNKDQALNTAKRMESYLQEKRESFVGHKNDIASSLEQIKHCEKPVLLLDMGDNVGGGGPANNICLLEAFEKSGIYKYFVCIYDSQAVIDCSAYKPGDNFKLTIEGTSAAGIQPYNLDVTLLRLTDGNFIENNPRHGGQVSFRMGKTAVVSTKNRSVIMLTSLRVMPFSLQQLISSGIDPADFDAIVAKGVNAPIAAYSPVCPTIIQVNTPGVTQADMTLFDYRQRRKPLYPFEKN